MIVHGQRFVAAPGGRGGFGNEHFKTSTHQAPRESTQGEPMVERTLRLELKLLADVGLIGLPNAGKSTMLRALSRATPRVADYPFTTLSPCLGVAELPSHDGVGRRIVVADNPGLIEGAAEGAGLGHEFLRHIERTRLLVHVVEVAPIDGSNPVDNYEAIRAELARYDDALAEKPELVVLNKIDVIPAAERDRVLKRLRAGLRLSPESGPLAVSGATGEGVRAMLEACWKVLVGAEAPPGWRERSADGA